MWTDHNYRRNLLDMHISDAKPEYLQKIDMDGYVRALVAAGMQAAVIKAKPHTGLCYWPASIGEMHKNLHGLDYVGEMIRRCHENGIQAVVYYSQIYDNWAYDHHPAWRLVTPEGKGFKECDDGKRMHETGRYGIVCPNNPEYRAYVRHNLEELNHRYDFEGMFLDMAFWPEVCYCDSCRERYLKEAGREIPRKIDWENPDWVAFADRRDAWMRDFVEFSTNTVKAIHPDVTVEHNFAMVTSYWRHGCTELLSDAMDFASGDFYGGFAQQSFICKFYHNVSRRLPFCYHTSRCVPHLEYHTTIKTPEELTLVAITAMLHGGAFLNADAINPDGSIDPSVYEDTFRAVRDATAGYEPYVGDHLTSDVALWFATLSKRGGEARGTDVTAPDSGKCLYYDDALAMTDVLRQFHVPFDVVGDKNLRNLAAKALILPWVERITDAEMADLEAYLARGGSLYVSGRIGHPRLAELMGVRLAGETEHSFTYIAPTEAGEALFDGFTRKRPMTVPMAQQRVELTDHDCQVLGTMALPYTMTHTRDFAAIHSNPPGRYTDQPSALLKRVGAGKIFWIAAPVELTTPLSTRRMVHRALSALTGGFSFRASAPEFVEILRWEKDGKTYLAAINQQNSALVYPQTDITVTLPERFDRAALVPSGENARVEALSAGCRVHLPKLELFMVLELSNGTCGAMAE